MLNSIQIIGHVGRDVKQAATKNGKDITNFSVAVNKRGKDGETETQWFNIVCFGKTAEIARLYVRSGNLIHVSGELSVRTYEGRDGSTKTSVDIIAARLVLLTPKSEKSIVEEDSIPKIADVMPEIPF